MHVSNLYGSPQGEAYAARLVENTFADTVFLTNSGAEAVECAIKTARAYHSSAGNPEKHILITFNNALHGRRSEEHTSELQSLMRIAYDVSCWKNTKLPTTHIATPVSVRSTIT